MNFGRQVVRFDAITLRPVRRSTERASTSTPWQIAPTGRSSAQNAATRSWSSPLPRYWRIPGACPPGRISPSNAAVSISAHAIGARNSGDSVSRR